MWFVVFMLSAAACASTMLNYKLTMGVLTVNGSGVFCKYQLILIQIKPDYFWSSVQLVDLSYRYSQWGERGQNQ